MRKNTFFDGPIMKNKRIESEKCIICLKNRLSEVKFYITLFYRKNITTIQIKANRV